MVVSVVVVLCNEWSQGSVCVMAAAYSIIWML